MPYICFHSIKIIWYIGILDGGLRRGAWEGVVKETKLLIYNIVFTKQNGVWISFYCILLYLNREFTTGASGRVPGEV